MSWSCRLFGIGFDFSVDSRGLSLAALTYDRGQSNGLAPAVKSVGKLYLELSRLCLRSVRLYTVQGAKLSLPRMPAHTLLLVTHLTNFRTVLLPPPKLQPRTHIKRYAGLNSRRRI